MSLLDLLKRATSNNTSTQTPQSNAKYSNKAQAKELAKTADLAAKAGEGYSLGPSEGADITRYIDKTASQTALGAKALAGNGSTLSTLSNRDGGTPIKYQGTDNLSKNSTLHIKESTNSTALTQSKIASLNTTFGRTAAERSYLIGAFAGSLKNENSLVKAKDKGFASKASNFKTDITTYT